MILLEELLAEIEFSVYQAMIRVTHTEDITVQDLGELLRAVPGVLTIVQVDHDGDSNTAVMKAKILTTKSAQEAFSAFKKNSFERIPNAKKIEVAEKTIEKL